MNEGLYCLWWLLVVMAVSLAMVVVFNPYQTATSSPSALPVESSATSTATPSPTATVFAP